MKITSIEITHHSCEVDPPYPAAWDSIPRGRFAASNVRIETDSGLVGYGSGDTCYGFPDYQHYFLGKDPRDIERHNGVLENIAFHHSRCWPVELALWDLVAKDRGLNVAQALGGSATSVPLYCSTGSLRPVQIHVAEAKRRVAEGFRAIKLRFGRADWRDDVAVVEAVRDAVGPDIDLMVDMNQGWRMPWDTQAPREWDEVAQIEKALRPVGLYWLEEALHRGDYQGNARLRKQAHCRLAGGEMTRELHEAYAMMAAGGLDVYQQDVTLVGGVVGLQRLAAKAREHGAVFTPHTWGNGFGLMANAQLLAAVDPDQYLEFPYDPPEWTEEARDFNQDMAIMADQGRMQIPQRPGWGVELI